MGTHEITQRPGGIDVSGTFESEAELDDFVRSLYCASEGVWPSPTPEKDAADAEPSDTTIEDAAPVHEPRKFSSISERQQRIAELLREGCSRGQIADRLCITTMTFDNDRKVLRQKGLI